MRCCGWTEAAVGCCFLRGAAGSPEKKCRVARWLPAPWHSLAVLAALPGSGAQASPNSLQQGAPPAQHHVRAPDTASSASARNKQPCDNPGKQMLPLCPRTTSMWLQGSSWKLECATGGNSFWAQPSSTQPAQLSKLLQVLPLLSHLSPSNQHGLLAPHWNRSGSHHSSD